MLRARARIDLGAIERNCRRLDAAAGDAALCAVVKGDGYGHGAVPAARAALAGGATWLAVATANEASALREAGIDARLVDLGALSPDELDVALQADADVVAWTSGLLDAVAARGGGRVHIKLDTGMGRLGTRDPAEATALARRAVDDPALTLAGLLTHFATADDLGDGFLDEQLARFVDWATPLKRDRPNLVLHAANSAATLREPRAHFDLVRCGVAIYGLDPFGRDPAEQDLEPAMTLTSYVAAVKGVQPGESAGYGRRFVAEEPATLATVPIGYADGVRRGLTNNADILIGGRRRPLAGTVSMDNVTALVDDDVSELDEVVLIGEQDGERVLAEEWAARLGTINYEVTCGISARVPREYGPDDGLEA
ncbi:MAG: Alanine racemase [uncultured Solirubrobacteraceae bacterium]|uniref:Alanine racemase n=1 Tax=uncultured Solirubrobacteraceae bacterium TaxID=1162706 RepID=A0A6J4SPA2_9ACTN|nr:MAG: Alanine racemase [uncultured Solirubrobacteraceae bacterium]